MKMTGKAAVMGIGLLLAASGALASGRARTGSAGGGAAIADHPAAPAGAATGAPTAVEIAPGIYQVTTASGDTLEMRADGAVLGASIERTYGSVERMVFESRRAGMERRTMEDGTVLFADGTVAFFEDMVGPSVIEAAARREAEAKKAEKPEIKPATVADLKQTKAWIELNDGKGVSQTVFLDGTVLAEQVTSRSPAARRARFASRVINGQVVYADGAVFAGEPAVE